MSHDLDLLGVGFQVWRYRSATRVLTVPNLDRAK